MHIHVYTPMQLIVLDRRIGMLGLSIVGGVDHASRVFGQGKPGVYVSKVHYAVYNLRVDT